MVVRLLDAGDVPLSISASWSELQLAEPTLASPFFRPEFTRIVAAARPGVLVAVLDDRVFFPFQRGPMRSGLPVGSRLSDYHGLVATPDAEVDVSELLARCRLSTWEFDGLVAAQSAFQPFHARSRVSALIDVSEGYDAYAASRREAGSDQLADAEKQAERLASRVGKVRFEAHVPDPRALDLLFAWKSAQYRRTGAVDIFRYSWVRDAVRRTHSISERAFAGMLSALYAGGEPVALHLALRSASVWHSWLPAYDPQYAAYSPGAVLLAQMAKVAAELGLDAIDLGKGDALYKRRFANAEVELAAGVLRRPSPAAVVDTVERAALRVLRSTPVGAIAQRAATRRRLR